MALIRMLLLEIKLNATTAVGNLYPEFELPILEEMHDDAEFGGVVLKGESTLEMDVADTKSLYELLKSKYQGRSGDAIVEKVYPNLKAFEKALAASVEEAPKAAKAAKAADNPPKD
jgi:hypothetical protein